MAFKNYDYAQCFFSFSTSSLDVDFFAFVIFLIVVKLERQGFLLYFVVSVELLNRTNTMDDTDLFPSLKMMGCKKSVTNTGYDKR